MDWMAEANLVSLVANIERLDGQDQMNAIGEALYPFVYDLVPQKAGRILSMMLEFGPNILLEYLRDPTSIKGIVQEALNIMEGRPPNFGLTTNSFSELDPKSSSNPPDGDEEKLGGVHTNDQTKL